MNTKRILQAAALVSIVLAIGHSLGSPWTPDESVSGQGVVGAMQGHSFDAMGFQRSYFDFYIGFGWMLGACLFCQAGLLWLIADWTAVIPRFALQVILVLSVQWLTLALLTFWFLFLLPGVLASLIFLLLTWAIVSLRRVEEPERAATF
jgi:hypothetical protein